MNRSVEILIRLGWIAFLPLYLLIAPATALSADATSKGGTSYTGQAAGKFELYKDKYGIRIYRRARDGSNFYEIKAVLHLENQPENVARLLRDSYSSCRKWMQNCVERREVDRGKDFAYYYNVMPMPWPLTDRDIIAIARFSSSTKGFVIQLNSTPAKIKEYPDRLRITEFTGSWTVHTVHPGRVRIEYFMFIDPGGGIPAVIANPFIANATFEVLRNLKKVNHLYRSDK